MIEAVVPVADRRRAELESLRVKNDGVLRPEDVVTFAENPKTALHGAFTWDDGEAAHQYRLWQARTIIRVLVTIVEPSPGESKEIKTYVSLVSDRSTPGGGYRSTVDVLSTADGRAELLANARAELLVFRRKYARLTELAKVFEAIDQLQ